MDSRSEEFNDSDTSLSLIMRLKHVPEDGEAWNRFVARYGSRILGWCRAWGVQNADALDLSQTVLCQLYEKFRSFEYDPSKSFRGWLRTLTRHAWRDSIRKKRPLPTGGDPQIQALIERLEAREDLVKRVQREFDLEMLEVAQRRVRARVGAKTWEAYRLLAVELLSGREVAERLGMNIASVYMARHNVKEMIKEELKVLSSGKRPD
jgi:RNA polymerase sigma-70 factor (ECF subfamily)